MIRPSPAPPTAAEYAAITKVTETRQAKARSADRPRGPLTPILAQDG